MSPCSPLTKYTSALGTARHDCDHYMSCLALPGPRSTTSRTHLTAPEFTGTLLGFDDYVNMVLEDVVEL